MYCECFANGKSCGADCACESCFNDGEHPEVVTIAKCGVLKRNPKAFVRKSGWKSHMKGCNCKRSGCLKAYCECYQSSLACTEHCKCSGCKNCTPPSKPNPFKRQRK
jgi:hypothetical protein